MGTTRATRDLLQDQHHCHHEQPPQKGIAALETGGCMVHAAVFSAMQGTEIWSCPPALASRQRPQAWAGGADVLHREARPAHHMEEKGWKTICRHRHSLHAHRRFLLPSHLGEPKPAVVTVLGSKLDYLPDLSDPRHSVT